MWDDVASKSVLAVDFILVVKLWASQFAYGGRLDEACASLQKNGHSSTSLTSVERIERRQESDNLLKCGSDFMLAHKDKSNMLIPCLRLLVTVTAGSKIFLCNVTRALVPFLHEST